MSLTLGLVAISFLLQFLTMRRDLYLYDEGFVTFDALRILRGGVPYRDFWTQHAPGQFYVLAFLFKSFGPSIMVERCWDLLIRAGITVVSFTMIAEWAPRKYALLGWAVCGIWLSYLGYNGFPLYPALLFCLLSAYAVSLCFNGDDRLWIPLVAGLFAGLAAAFRHDLGFYIALTNTIMLSGRAFAKYRPNNADTSPWRLAAPVAVFCAGVLLACGPIILMLLWAVPAGDLIFSLLTMPARIYPAVRSLPFPSPVSIARQAITYGNLTSTVDLSIYWPLLVAAAAFTVRMHIGAGQPPNHGAASGNAPINWCCRLLVLALLLLYVKGLVRVSPLHLAQSIVFAIVLLCVLAGNLRPTSRFAKAVLAFCAVALAMPTAVAFAEVLHRANANVRAFLQTDHNPCKPPSGLEAMKCFETDADTIQAMSYIVAHTAKNEMIYVGTGRHDKILESDVMFYFVTGRSSITKWHQLHPGLQTTAPIQAEMVAEFRLHKPNYVVLDSEWDALSEPNASAFSSGVTLLDDFVHRNYVQVASFGPVSILKASDKPQ